MYLFISLSASNFTRCQGDPSVWHRCCMTINRLKAMNATQVFLMMASIISHPKSSRFVT